MKVFLSYASEDRRMAEQISFAIAEQGHDVFVDRDDLPPGEEFHTRIRQAIEQSDLFVFLLSEKALDADSYTIVELEIAQKTWPRPAGKILPVVLRESSLNHIPEYLKSVTLLQPAGNIAASVADRIYRIARARRRTLLARGGAAGVVALLLVVSIAYHVTGAAPDEITGSDGAPALRIPAGTFVMGDDENSPRREVYTDMFYMDKFEVTVGRYAKYLQVASVRRPDFWDEVDPRTMPDFPVVGVDWNDANAYCRWAEKRLPTEAEWERAARGTDGRSFPWGNQTPAVDRANFGNASPKPYEGGLAKVGSHPAGTSPYGVHDMAGNASEWVADWYAESFRSTDVRNRRGSHEGERKVIRGGGRFDTADRLSVTKRYFAAPEERSEEIGFRCAR